MPLPPRVRWPRADHIMSGRETDVAIVGGGLAGGLIALALHRAQPDLRFQLIEAGETLGGHHRWSWFESDLGHEGRALLSPFTYVAWDQGYEVAFPHYRRPMRAGYRSLASADFDAALREILPERTLSLGQRVCELDANGVTLQSGECINARTVIDCRGVLPSQHLLGGWQIFAGHSLD